MSCVLRRRAVLGLLLSSLLAGCSSLPNGAETPGRVAVRQLDLVDEQGRVRGSWFLQGGQPVLSFRNEKGQERIRLRLTDGGAPALSFYGADGHANVALYGWEQLVFSRSGSKPHTVLGRGADGRPALTFRDDGGQVTMKLPK